MSYTTPVLREYISNQLGLNNTLSNEFINRLENLCENDGINLSPDLTQWIISNLSPDMSRVIHNFSGTEIPRLTKENLKNIYNKFPTNYKGVDVQAEFIRLFDRSCIELLAITLDYDILPGGVDDPNSVDDWNNYLRFLDGDGQPYSFDSVVLDGTSVALYGNSSINIIITSASGLSQDAGIASISDDGLIIELGFQALLNTFNLQTLTSESITTIGDVAFRGSGIVFQYTPNCTQLGETSGDDGVYLNVISPITVFVSSVLETNNGGNPDGDIDFLLTNYPGSTVTYI